MVAALVLPGAALAANVRVRSGVLEFVNANGELNDVSLSLSGGSYTVIDTEEPLAAQVGCASVNANEVACPAAGVDSLSIELGTGSDSVLVSADMPTTVVAKSGADTVTTAGGADTIDGGSGIDTIATAAGADSLVGGSGDDSLDGAPATMRSTEVTEPTL